MIIIKKLKILFLIFLACLSAKGAENPVKRNRDKHMLISDLCLLNNNRIAYSCGNSVYFGKIGDGNEYSLRLKNPDDEILCFVISGDRSTVVAGSMEGIITLWDMKNKLVRRHLNYHSSPVLALAVTSDSRYLCSGDKAGEIFILDTHDNKLLELPDRDYGEITSMKIVPGNNKLIWATSKGNIYVYDFAHNDLVEFPEKHSNWIRSLYVSADGEMVLSGGDDRRLIQWNIKGDKIKVLRDEVHHSWITSVSFLPDNQGFLLGQLNGKVTCQINIGSKYTFNCKAPVRALESYTDSSGKVSVIMATWGRGIILIPLSKLKMNTFKKANFINY